MAPVPRFTFRPIAHLLCRERLRHRCRSQEERKFLAFVDGLEPVTDDSASPYSVTVNIDIKFTRSKAKDALGVNVTDNPNAPEVRLSEEQVRERYPWDYERLTAECRKRFGDFKMVKKYHDLRKKLAEDKRFGHLRLLDPNRPKGQKKTFFNPNIMSEFDKHYTKA